jgi:hypothetical protein
MGSACTKLGDAAVGFGVQTGVGVGPCPPQGWRRRVKAFSELGFSGWNSQKLARGRAELSELFYGLAGGGRRGGVVCAGVGLEMYSH